MLKTLMLRLCQLTQKLGRPVYVVILFHYDKLDVVAPLTCVHKLISSDDSMQFTNASISRQYMCYLFMCIPIH